jgi:hypothetical protein
MFVMFTVLGSFAIIGITIVVVVIQYLGHDEWETERTEPRRMKECEVCIEKCAVERLRLKAEESKKSGKTRTTSNG